MNNIEKLQSENIKCQKQIINTINIDTQDDSNKNKIVINEGNN